MKKRIVLLAMAAVMAMGTLTGCVTTQQEAQAAADRESILNEWSERYDAKSAPEE